MKMAPTDLHRSRPCIAVALAALFLASGCSQFEGPKLGKNVDYGDPRAIEALTIAFGSSDIQILAESIVRSILSANVLKPTGTNAPFVTIGEIENDTSEYIDTQAIVDKIKVDLFRSGAARVVVGASRMRPQVDELSRQNDSGLYAQAGRSERGSMTPSRYRLQGFLASINKRADKMKDSYYVLNMELIDNQSGVLVWTDEKEIRKTTAKK